MNTMKRKRCNEIVEDEPQFEISSLVDVSFLLLIYFLVVNTIQPQEKDLPMTLPSSGGAGPVGTVSLTIELKDDGSIVMNAGGEDELLDHGGSGRDIPLTKERLQLFNSVARANGSEVSIRMQVASEASHQRFIDVLNCLRGEDINILTLSEVEEQL